MKKKIKAALFWTSIPLLSAGFMMGFRYAEAHWFGYVPMLECPRTLDLGERDTGDVAVGRFRIKNVGKKTLIAKEFSTSCSCAGVEREIDGNLTRVKSIELSPREAVELTVRVGIGVQPGESQTVAVSFETNDPFRPLWQIDVIIPRVGGGYFAQPSAVVFGPLLVGDKTRRTIDLFNNRVAGRQVDQIRSTHSDRFTVKLLPLSEEDKQRVHPTAGNLFARIEVAPCSDHPGPIAGEVHVSLVKETHRTAPISVLGEVISPVVCRPAMLVLPRRVGDRSIRSGDLLIFHRREKPIDVSLDALPPEITAQVQAIAGRPDQRSLHIDWHPAASPNKHSASATHLRLRVRAVDEETKLEVPIFLAEKRS